MLPPTRVLAAVDFSRPAGVALDFASRLACQVGADLHLVHVPPMSAGATSVRGADFAGEMYEDLRSFAAGVPAVLGREPRFHVVVGHPARVIRDIAHRESCDLIVVGTHGLSSDPVEVLGSTTEELLREGGTSVLVVPEAWTPPSPHRDDLTGVGPIIAGLDFTCPSIDAATAAARLASRLRTRLIVVHALTPPETSADRPGDAEARARQQCAEAARRLEPVLAALREMTALDLRIERGGIATTLARAARAEPHGLLVLGRPVRGRSSGPPGAVASRVLMHIHVPLLVHGPRPSSS
jgi:nucleotide-binding universal stress UspA family protein